MTGSLSLNGEGGSVHYVACDELELPVADAAQFADHGFVELQ